MSLSEMKADREVVVNEIVGDGRFLSRITSIGITPGCRVKILRNDRNRPMLIFSRCLDLFSECCWYSDSLKRLA